MGSNWDSAYPESLDESPEMPTATGMKIGLPGRSFATGLEARFNTMAGR